MAINDRIYQERPLQLVLKTVLLFNSPKIFKGHFKTPQVMKNKIEQQDALIEEMTTRGTNEVQQDIQKYQDSKYA